MERTDAQWVLDFELKGAARDEALALAARVFEEWGLVRFFLLVQLLVGHAAAFVSLLGRRRFQPGSPG